MKYKLNRTLYYDPDFDGIDDWKRQDCWELFARKGQIFEIYLLTDELREEYNIEDEDKKWKFIAIAQTGWRWCAFEENDQNLLDWFDIMEEHRANNQ